MTDRLQIDRLLHELYAARVRGDLESLCRLFSNTAKLRFAGASDTIPITIASAGVAEFRPLLSLMIKSFKLVDCTIVSMIIDGGNASVHWQAEIQSRITGAAKPTELIDLVEIQDGQITSYTEFFVPRKFYSAPFRMT